jgi:NAD(P)H-dependent FMN reductase
MSTKPTILILSTSAEDSSRSRAAARIAAQVLREDGRVTPDFVDLREHDIGLYPTSDGTPECLALAERFNNAIGWIIAAPVHDWNVSGATLNLLVYLLDRERAPYRPFLQLAGAGGLRSQFAFEGLARMLTTEIEAVQVGPAILCTEREFDAEQQPTAEMRQRVTRAVKALIPIALASAHAHAER